MTPSLRIALLCLPKERVIAEIALDPAEASQLDEGQSACSSDEAVEDDAERIAAEVVPMLNSLAELLTQTAATDSVEQQEELDAKATILNARAEATSVDWIRMFVDGAEAQIRRSLTFRKRKTFPASSIQP